MSEMDWVVVALVLGSAARVTRFIALDTLGVNTIRKPVFNWLARWPRVQDWWDSLTGCVYCLGFWVTLGVMLSALEWRNDGWWLFVAALLTGSMLVAWLVGLVARATEF